MEEMCSYEIRPPLKAEDGSFIYFEAKILENVEVTMTIADSLTSTYEEVVTCDV